MDSPSRPSNPADPEAYSCLVTVLAILSLICGSWVAAIFVFGVGLGDTWIIYPPDVPLAAWLIPVLLFAFPVLRFGRRLSARPQVTLGSAFLLLVVAAVILVVVLPFYRRETEQREYEEQFQKEIAFNELAAKIERQESIESPDSAVAVRWPDLKWELSEDGKVEASNAPQRIRDLVGERISLTGYMYPTVEPKTEGFLLMTDQVTGFGYEGELWQCAFVTMTHGQTVTYTTRPVTVVGTFSIDPFIDGAETVLVYQVLADTVRPRTYPR